MYSPSLTSPSSCDTSGLDVEADRPIQILLSLLSLTISLLPGLSISPSYPQTMSDVPLENPHGAKRPRLEPNLLHETNCSQAGKSTTTSKIIAEIEAEIVAAKIKNSAESDPFRDEDRNDAPAKYTSPAPSSRDYLKDNYTPPNPKLTRAEINFYGGSNPEIMWLFHVRRLAAENFNRLMDQESEINESNFSEYFFYNRDMSGIQRERLHQELDFAKEIDILPWVSEAHARNCIIRYSQANQQRFDESLNRLHVSGDNNNNGQAIPNAGANLNTNIDILGGVRGAGDGVKESKIMAPALPDDWYPGYFYYLNLKGRYLREHPCIRAINGWPGMLPQTWSDEARDPIYAYFRLNLRRFDWHSWVAGWGRP
ncbi:hypothetical protein TWF694_009672 [Orbilia ellipsospora]|uniref:Uncharacterized protein n=1 Tax=Orbilia ellipsospora TaxID=2528407 RepID=A0AAV9XHY2_9PEZI